VAPILKSATGFEGLICEQKIQSDYILVQNARFAANDELLDQLPLSCKKKKTLVV
jgi:hypothetical protein